MTRCAACAPTSDAMTHDEAVAELRRCAGTQFDADVVEVVAAVALSVAATAAS